MSAKKSLSLRAQLVGFPLWQISLLSIARLSEPITFTSLFPYVYFMVQDFHVAKNESDISKYVGYLSSSFAVFEFVFSLQFGIYLDKFGRKLTLIFGILGMGLCVLAFGFSKTYWQAMVSRSLMGAFNGSSLVIRTVIGEVAVKKRHQAILFSTYPLGWCVGSVVGPLIPAISSTFYPARSSSYDPKESLVFKTIASSPMIDTNSLEKLVTKYPYCLSNIIISTFLGISALLLFLFLEETQMEMKYTRDIGLDIGDFIKRCFGVKTPTRPWKSFQPELYVESDLESPLVDEESSTTANYGSLIHSQQSKDSSSTKSSASSSHSSIQAVGSLNRRLSHTIIDHYSSRRNSIIEETPKYSNLQSIFLPLTFHTLLSSFLMSAHCLIFDEFLPVFLSSNIMREDPNDISSPLASKFPFKLIGGLGYSTKQVGNALAFTGAIGVLVVLFVFPYLDGRYKSINVYRAVLMFFPISYFLLPYLIFTIPPNRFTDSSSLTTFSVYSLFMMKTFGQSNAFPEIMLLLHRATPPGNRSFINGALMSSTALARFLGLLLWGYIMSWANSHAIAWFPWWTLGFMSTFAAIQSFFINIPDDDDDEDDEDDEDENEDEDELNVL